MSRQTVLLSVGIGLFAIGGMLLAYGGERAGAPIGTLCGLAGLGLILWSWFGRGGGFKQ